MRTLILAAALSLSVSGIALAQAVDDDAAMGPPMMSSPGAQYDAGDDADTTGVDEGDTYGDTDVDTDTDDDDADDDEE
jgi:hypothetical protein